MINIPATLLLTLSLIFSGGPLSAADEAHLKNVAQDYLTKQSQVLSVQTAPMIAKTDISILDILSGKHAPDKPTAKNMTPAVAPLLASAQVQTAPKTRAMSTAYETDINPVQPSTTPLKPTAPAKQSNPIKLSEKRDANGNPYASIEAYIADTYVLAKDSDFIGDRNGQFMYAGSAEYVIVPTTIKGVKITSTVGMFQGNYTPPVSVKGVICDNPNITDMRAMFWDSLSDTLELNLNTTNVKDMSWMFNGARANELILTSFDTSKVEDFSAMFTGARAKNFDVSTFNTSSGIYFNQMFDQTLAETINIRHFDVSNAETLSNMFSRTKFKTLDLRHFDISNVQDIGGIFSGMESSHVDISSFGFKLPFDFHGLFAGAKVESVDLSNLIIGPVRHKLPENYLLNNPSIRPNIKTIYIHPMQDPEIFRAYCYPDNNTNLIVK